MFASLAAVSATAALFVAPAGAQVVDGRLGETPTQRVTSAVHLRDVLHSDFKGRVIVPADIDWPMNDPCGDRDEFGRCLETPLTDIPVRSGVQLIGERGALGSRPLLRATHDSSGYALFTIDGSDVRTEGNDVRIVDNDVRIEGLHLLGPKRPKDRFKENAKLAEAIYVTEHAEKQVGRRVLISDNELERWTNAVSLKGAIEVDTPKKYDSGCSPPCPHFTRTDAVLVRVERNYIHDNVAYGGGYGVVVGGGVYGTVEGNVFEFNNHSVAASGKAYSGYVARYNYLLRGVYTFGSDRTYPHSFDVHGRGGGENEHAGGPAGTFFEVASNTVLGDQKYGFLGRLTRAAFALRGRPAEQARLIRNVFTHERYDGAVKLRAGDDASLDEDRPNTFNLRSAGNRYDADYSTELATGDFDGDGRTDAFVANGTAWFFSRAGIRPWEFLRASNKRIRELGFADMTGDGITDVLYRDPAGKLGHVAAGRAAQVSYFTSSPVPMQDLRFGDFDGDGLTDIFYTRRDQWHIWYGRTRAWTEVGSSSQPISGLLFGEFDDVRGTDVAAVTRSAWSYSSAATQRWARLNGKLTDSFTTGVAADFDGNGKSDIAFGGVNKWRFSRDGRSRLTDLRDGGNSRPYGPLRRLLVGRFDGGPRAAVVAFAPERVGPAFLPGARLAIWSLGSGKAFSERSWQNMR